MGSVAKPVVCIVTPGTRAENNGNWRTAARWTAMLRDHCRVIVQTRWDGTPANALIALHARRSAESIARFSTQAPGRAIAVMLTGTDLYRDLPTSAEAQASLDHADRIVVLQEDAPNLLEPRWRAKAQVIYQSARPLTASAKARGRLECVALGHLREEKDPATLFRAMDLLPASLPVCVRHIGAALEGELGAQARALQAREPRYRYLGALPHGLARCALKAAHLLVHPSRMEGGANAIVEAVTCGTPVIASRISGNVGMLGADYAGYFETGDGQGLARLLERCLEDPAYLRSLAAQCRRRQALFRPEAEARAVRRLVDSLVA